MKTMEFDARELPGDADSLDTKALEDHIVVCLLISLLYLGVYTFFFILLALSVEFSSTSHPFFYLFAVHIVHPKDPSMFVSIFSSLFSSHVCPHSLNCTYLIFTLKTKTLDY